MSFQVNYSNRLVKGEDLNHHGTLYAGRTAEWFVEAGFVAAARLTNPENIVCLQIYTTDTLLPTFTPTTAFTSTTIKTINPTQTLTFKPIYYSNPTATGNFVNMYRTYTKTARKFTPTKPVLTPTNSTTKVTVSEQASQSPNPTVTPTRDFTVTPDSVDFVQNDNELLSSLGISFIIGAVFLIAAGFALFFILQNRK